MVFSEAGEIPALSRNGGSHDPAKQPSQYDESGRLKPCAQLTLEARAVRDGCDPSDPSLSSRTGGDEPPEKWRIR